MSLSGRGGSRLRLSEWARREGISRITAYRMLRRGILPVPAERSPTGRWYVQVPGSRFGRSVIYARACGGRSQADALNDQIALLSEWAANHNRTIFTVVKEIANPLTDPLPRLARLLADIELTEIIIHNPDVVGIGRYQLLVAALASQQRALTAVRPVQREDDLEEAMRELAAHMV